MVQVRTISSLRPTVFNLWPRRYLALIFVLGLGGVEPVLNPPAADACFFWQACARRRGQASNTRAGGKRTGRILGGNDASLPYVISPRNAWIQQPGPGQPYPIRWNAVDGVNSYTIRLWQWTYERDLPDLALWETTVATADPIPFPALILDPGTYYSIEVVTDTGVSSDLDAGYFDSGFQLLFEEDYDVLRSQLAAVVPADPADTLPTGQGTSENAALARAGVFFLEEMYADALAVLEPLPLAAPGFAEAWNQKAFAHFLKFEFDEALEDLDRTLEIEPRHFGALSGRALTLMRQGRMQLGQTALRDALKVHPFLPERALLIEPSGEEI